MQLVLAAAATDAAIACGGAVTSDVQSDPSGTGTGSSENGSSSGSSSGSSGSSSGDPDRDGGGDAADDADGGKDAQVDAPDAKPDQWTQGCVTGSLDPNPALCCKTPNDPLCNGGGGGDMQCSLDCNAVCKSVAPGVTGGFNDCYWSASGAAPKIFYMCGACGVGRIPDGTIDCERGASVGERLAMQAYYEAVSVLAFRRLADVLVDERAPRSLIDRVIAAAEDESRHAELFTRLATERGACVRVPSLDASERPGLLELAIENAREGCIRETYGALVALHQSTHAEDEHLRAAFASIADDEIEHATLSWDLAMFFEARLGESHAEHRATARASLRLATTRQHDAIDNALGVPAPEAAERLFDDLFARIAA